MGNYKFVILLIFTFCSYVLGGESESNDTYSTADNLTESYEYHWGYMYYASGVGSDLVDWAKISSTLITEGSTIRITMEPDESSGLSGTGADMYVYDYTATNKLNGSAVGGISTNEYYEIVNASRQNYYIKFFIPAGNYSSTSHIRYNVNITIDDPPGITANMHDANEPNNITEFEYDLDQSCNNIRLLFTPNSGGATVPVTQGFTYTTYYNNGTRNLVSFNGSFYGIWKYFVDVNAIGLTAYTSYTVELEATRSNNGVLGIKEIYNNWHYSNSPVPSPTSFQIDGGSATSHDLDLSISASTPGYDIVAWTITETPTQPVSRYAGGAGWNLLTDYISSINGSYTVQNVPEDGDGSITLYLWIQDDAGNVCATPATDDITLNTLSLDVYTSNGKTYLFWDSSPAPSDGFAVLRDNSNVSGKLTGNEYTDNSLTNGTTYEYQVVAYNTYDTDELCRSNAINAIPISMSQITSSVEWPGANNVDKIKISEDINVSSTGNLTIAPGTIIEISPSNDDNNKNGDAGIVSIQVDGTMTADDVIFRAAGFDAPGDWYGFKFSSNTSSSKLSNCEIHDADKAIDCYYVNEPELKILSCEITGNNYGIYSDNSEVYFGFDIINSVYQPFPNYVHDNDDDDIYATPMDGWYDDYIEYNDYGSASPVELTDFTAKYNQDTVYIYWRTETETDNLGFNIWRSENDEFTNCEKINSSLISGAGTSGTPHEYYFNDGDICNGVTYFYKLEQIDYAGSKQWYTIDGEFVEYEGLISNNEEWNDTINVIGDITISSGCTLTISSGTIVKLLADSDSMHTGTNSSLCEIVVNGALVAEASGGTPIIFTSSNCNGEANDWYGIKSYGYSSLKNCIIQYPSYAIRHYSISANTNIDSCEITNFGYYAVNVGTGAISVKNSNISHNEYSNGRGISLGSYNLVSAEIVGNTISNFYGDNYIYGITVATIANNNVVIKDNSISNIFNGSRRWGIYLSFADSILVDGNSIQNISSIYSRGIYVYGSDYDTLANNIITNADSMTLYGIYLSTSDYTLISNNTISNCSNRGIECYNSGSTLVEDNELTDNENSYAININGSSSIDCIIRDNTIKSNLLQSSCHVGVASNSYAYGDVINNVIEDFKYYGIATGAYEDSLFCGSNSDSGYNKIYWNFDDKGFAIGCELIYNAGSDTIYALNNYYGYSPSSDDFYGPVKWQSYLSAPSIPMLVSYYPICEIESSYVKNYGVYGDQGTISGASWVSSGISNSSLDFDGSNDYVDLYSSGYASSLFNNNDDFTIIAWVNPDSFPIDGSTIDGASIVGQRYGTGVVFGIRSDGKLFLNIDDTRTSSPKSDDALIKNQWQQVAVTYDNTNDTCCFYIDGELSGKGLISDGTINTIQDVLYIGWQNYTSGTYMPGYFSGGIDEVKIFNSVLTNEEITNQYNLHQEDASVVLYYSMNEGTGSVLDDKGIYDNDGDIYGASWVEGVKDSALDFDGTNDYVNIDNDPSMQLDGDLTISFWLYPHDLGNARENPIDKSYGGEFAFTLEDDPEAGKLTYYHGTQRASGYYYGWNALSTGTIVDDSWQLVVLTRKESNREIKIYYNGDSVNTDIYSSLTDRLPSKSSYPVVIGNGYTNNFFDGLVDEVKIYNRVLTSQEIEEYYNSLAWGLSKTARPIQENSKVIPVNIEKDFVNIFPNPFKSTLEIIFDVPVETHLLSHVDLKIYNTEGKLIKAITDDDYISGKKYSVKWDGKNNAGKEAGAGFYYYSIVIGQKNETGRIMKLK